MACNQKGGDTMFELNASRIRSLTFERGLGVYELARQAKINAVTAAKVLKDGATATAKTVSALAKFFCVDGEELILKG